MQHEYIKFEQAPAAKIILNRPDVMNSFNKQMALELQETLDYCGADETVRAVYIIGEGKSFSAGQDMEEILSGGKTGEVMHNYYNPIIWKIRNLDKPVVCAVNGAASGIGANIAFASDITLAAKSAYFHQPFAKLGLIPDSGGTFFLPRLIGLQRAAGMLMLADKINAEEAYSLGLVYKIIFDDTFEDDSYAVAVKLASMPAKGLALTKKAFNNALSSSLEEQLELEEELQTIAGESPEFKENVKNLLEKKESEYIAR